VQYTPARSGELSRQSHPLLKGWVSQSKSRQTCAKENWGDEVFEDFFGAVEVTWQDPSFAHPGGESSAEAQRRGLAVLKRLQAEGPNETVVLSTHGNLMALILQVFDPSVDFQFWKSLTMPDIYKLDLGESKLTLRKIWLQY
jgi:broad specificity phosphatase PhoE